MAKIILVVDDHAAVRKALRRLLESYHYEVHEAENGLEAIRQAQTLSPDLVVLDLAMPILNGLDAARVLHKLLPKTLLMMFTNTASAMLEEDARYAGISAVVSKSDAMDYLLRQTESLLN